MKNMTQTVRMSLILLAGTSLFACAPFFGDGISWQPTPGTRVVQADLRSSIGYYESAVTAINARRYALALDYLQAARTQKPDDVRVLTAFGVIYDKLGRFDLSARYYTQAAALDPRSTIIARDMDYSRKLQDLISPRPAPMVAEATPPDPAGGIWLRTEDVAQPMIVAAASIDKRPAEGPIPTAGHVAIAVGFKAEPKAGVPVASASKGVFLTGHPLMLINGSGRSDAVDLVSRRLAGLGWSVAKSAEMRQTVEPQTTIFFEQSMITAAKALAHTLALPTRLAANSDIKGLQLILGSDISNFDSKGTPPRNQRKQIALATNSLSRE